MVLPFADHFSQQADDYARYRPGYPDRLYTLLAEQCQSHEMAWDCACGNGQSTRGLLNHFRHVVASDASPAQLTAMPSLPGTLPLICRAEQAALVANSVDLILVVQALHWFDREVFYNAVDHVLKPGGVFAACTYNLLQVNEQVDEIITHLYQNILQPYWAPQRRHVEQAYSDYDFPYQDISKHTLNMHAQWTLEHLLGYVRTWSAVQAYLNENGHDPIAPLQDDLQNAWGEAEQLQITWPLTIYLNNKPMQLSQASSDQ